MGNLIRTFACVCAVGLSLAAAPARAVDTVVLDTLGTATSTTTFSVFGAGGQAVFSSQLVGPRFTLSEQTVITEIGGFVNVCESIIGGVPQCPVTRPLVVQIRREVAGGPDPSGIVASFVLSHDDDPLTISYEHAQPEHALDAGTYFAVFAPQETDVGVLVGFASSPFPYLAGLTVVGFVDPGSGRSFASEQFAAVRILGRAVAAPPKSPIQELDELLGRLGDAGPARSLAAKVRVARAALAAGNTHAACGIVSALANEVQAQDGASLSEPQAADATAATARIAGAIGC